MRTLEAGLLYFALVFGTGFVLGTVRTLWIVPRLGDRTAELLEAPVMLAVIVAAARWTVFRLECRLRILHASEWGAWRSCSCSGRSSASCSGFAGFLFLHTFPPGIGSRARCTTSC